MAILDDIEGYLTTAGLTSGWTVTHGQMPQSPDAVIALFQTPGRSPEKKVSLDYPEVQVRVRAAKGGYATAEAKAVAIYDALNGPDPFTGASGRSIRNIEPRFYPAFLGMDANERPEIVARYEVWRSAT